VVSGVALILAVLAISMVKIPRKPLEDFEYTYRVASTSELQKLFKGIKSESIKHNLLAHIAEKGLTNTEFRFLMKVSDRFTGEDMV